MTKKLMLCPISSHEPEIMRKIFSQSFVHKKAAVLKGLWTYRDR